MARRGAVAACGHVESVTSGGIDRGVGHVPPSVEMRRPQTARLQLQCSIGGHGDSHITPPTVWQVAVGHELGTRREALRVTGRPVGFHFDRPAQRQPRRHQREQREHQVEHLTSMVQQWLGSHTGTVPELLEAEWYRRSLERVVGGTVQSLPVVDALVVPDGHHLAHAVLGAAITGVRRHGKVVIMQTEGASVGLRFGMTGRVIVGVDDPVPHLAYGAHAADERFDRWVVQVALRHGEVVTVRLSDARRLARVVLDLDVGTLGPDAASIDADVLAQRLSGRRRAIKAVLLDQQVVAGLGNLLADELLWRSGVAPHRHADELTAAEVGAMATTLPIMLDELMQRGGSHCGDLSPDLRRAGSTCPVDGAPLIRRSIGSRTSWWCPLHQR